MLICHSCSTIGCRPEGHLVHRGKRLLPALDPFDRLLLLLRWLWLLLLLLWLR
jgi:hypothetical protein